MVQRLKLIDTQQSADNVPRSEQSISICQQDVAQNIEQCDQNEVITDSDNVGFFEPPVSLHDDNTPSLEVEAVDALSWDTIWLEAYMKVKEDPKDARLLEKLELVLETGEDNGM